MKSVGYELCLEVEGTNGVKVSLAILHHYQLVGGSMKDAVCNWKLWERPHFTKYLSILAFRHWVVSFALVFVPNCLLQHMVAVFSPALAHVSVCLISDTYEQPWPSLH